MHTTMVVRITVIRPTPFNALRKSAYLINKTTKKWINVAALSRASERAVAGLKAIICASPPWLLC